MKKAELFTFSANTSDMEWPNTMSGFVSKSAMGDEEYDEFREYIFHKNGPYYDISNTRALSLMDPSFNIFHEYEEFVKDKIQNKRYSHGDIVWLPVYPGYERKGYGFHMIWDNDDGKRVLLWDDGLPPVNHQSVKHINYQDVCTEINDMLGWESDYENVWMLWSSPS